MTPINLYLRLQALQRQSPKLFAMVKALVGNQAQIEYPGGVRVMVSNPIAATVDQAVFVRDAEIVERAPTLTYVRAEI